MEQLDLATMVSAINVLLLLSLIFAYVKNYLSLRSVFTLGLILFAVLLMVQNLIGIYSQMMMIMYYSKEIAQFAFILNVCECLGLAVLAYVTWK